MCVCMLLSFMTRYRGGTHPRFRIAYLLNCTETGQEKTAGDVKSVSRKKKSSKSWHRVDGEGRCEWDVHRTHQKVRDNLKQEVMADLRINHVCKYGSLADAMALFKANPALVRNRDVILQFPLHAACCNQRLYGWKIVKFVLSEYPEAARQPDSLGRLPLHFAAGNEGPTHDARGMPLWYTYMRKYMHTYINTHTCLCLRMHTFIYVCTDR